MSARVAGDEVEAKYDVLDRVAARSLLAAQALGSLHATGPVVRVRLVDRYLDTTDARLHAAGWAARIRTAGESRIQLKALAAADEAGIARRREIEGEARPGLPIDSWPESDARTKLLELLAGDEPVEVLVLRQDRLTRSYGGGRGALEVSLDRLETLVGERPVARRLVLEVEQQRASMAEFRAALAVLDGLGFLGAARVTKLAWGMAVATRGIGDDGLPALPPVDGVFRVDDPTPEVGRMILANQLSTMIDRERVVRATASAEDIRRLRVATRRARAAMRAFEGSYVGLRPDRLRRGLRRFARLLNEVRNLDVLIGHVDAYREDLEPSDRAAIDHLRSTLEERRAEALAALLADCASKRHQRLMASFADFVQSPAGDVAPVWPPRARRLSDELGGWIWTGFEGLVGWRPILETVDLEALHELRLAAKRLRDLIQFTAPVLGPGASAVNGGLADLQDALGAMNDALVASRWLRSYLAAPTTRLPPDSRAAIDRFAGTLEDRIAVARALVPAAWRRVAGATGRRRIARLIGEI